MGALAELNARKTLPPRRSALLDYLYKSGEGISRGARAIHNSVISPMNWLPSVAASAPYMAPGGGIVSGFDSMTQGVRDIREGNYLRGGVGYAGGVFDAVTDAIPSLSAIPPIAPALRRRAGSVSDVTRNAQLPNLRALPREEAIAIAQQNPHLIVGPEGNFVGAPAHIKDKRSLNKQRKSHDAQIKRGLPGAYWYDDIRGGISEVTGGLPKAEEMMSKEHGMFSAGVSPEGELGYATKALNSTIAYEGVPTKVARPAQQQAGQMAAQSLDPNLFQLGRKTGEYAGKIDPAAAKKAAGATGVNDFRHFEELGWDDGKKVKGLQAHNWADYETAAAAGRWGLTGEQVQAASWVAQKADALLKSRNKFYMKRAQEMARPGDNRSVEDIAWQLSFDDAKKTARDFFPKHTAYATYESMPLAGSGQLQGLLDAPKVEQDAFALDPRNNWATAPGGRDALYAGMAHGPVEAGFGMRVRPTAQMQGVWDGPRGTEYNQGFVARPLVGFDTQAKSVKKLPEADRSLLTAAEATRAYMDVQGAGAAHKTFTGGPSGKTTSMFLRKSAPEQALIDEMRRVRAIGGRYGLPDAVDVNEGVTLTNFDGAPGPRKAAQQKALEKELYATGLFNKAYRANVDGVYVSFADEFSGKQGTGSATRKLLDTLDALPAGTQKAIDNNPYIAGVANAKAALYAEAGKRYGIAREDVQNALKIIGQGPQWRQRLRDALKSGVILPALGALIVAPSLFGPGEPQEG